MEQVQIKFANLHVIISRCRIVIELQVVTTVEKAASLCSFCP